uniref:Uncharacterized protein n=1 Tax=Arundo donax TaxID=35708 RepID=A0A0A9EN69_ARUDO
MQIRDCPTMLCCICSCLYERQFFRARENIVPQATDAAGTV